MGTNPLSLPPQTLTDISHTAYSASQKYSQRLTILHILSCSLVSKIGRKKILKILCKALYKEKLIIIVFFFLLIAHLLEIKKKVRNHMDMSFHVQYSLLCWRSFGSSLQQQDFLNIILQARHS